MMDDGVGLSGHERHVEGVEHDGGLQIGRECPSDDPVRAGVENDREVEGVAIAEAARLRHRERQHSGQLTENPPHIGAALLT
jgi:hypothetical protein